MTGLLLVAAASPGRPLAAANASKLPLGDELPPLEGKTLSGDVAALPRDTKGHPAILVIGFTKGAAKVTRPWLDGCRSAGAASAAEAASAAASAVTCYDVRMLEDVPRIFRGMVERGMRSGLPIELQRRTLLVYAENEAWRERVGAKEEKTAYVLGCDKEGRIRGTATGEFVERELKRILDAVRSGP